MQSYLFLFLLLSMHSVSGTAENAHPARMPAVPEYLPPADWQWWSIRPSWSRPYLYMKFWFYLYIQNNSGPDWQPLLLLWRISPDLYKTLCEMLCQTRFSNRTHILFQLPPVVFLLWVLLQQTVLFAVWYKWSVPFQRHPETPCENDPLNNETLLQAALRSALLSYAHLCSESTLYFEILPYNIFPASYHILHEKLCWICCCF